jgi:hypothetical protein
MRLGAPEPIIEPNDDLAPVSRTRRHGRGSLGKYAPWRPAIGTLAPTWANQPDTMTVPHR